MAEYTKETKDWISKADQSEKPFAKVRDHGTVILSLIRDASTNVASVVSDKGLACWRGVESMRPRRLRISAKPTKGRIALDDSERGVEGGVLRTELRLPAPHPEAPVFLDVDHSCRFSADNQGYEELESTCGNIKDRLTSRFFVDRAVRRSLNLTPIEEVPAADVLVVTALMDERDAFLRAGDRRHAVWYTSRDSSGFGFHWTSLKDSVGKRPVFVVTRACEMGETDAATVASRVFADLSRNAKPRCLVMPGICAGHPGKTRFGDVVVAERLFKFDEGKRALVKNPVTGESEDTIFHDIRTYNVDASLKFQIEEFSGKWHCQTYAERPKSYDHQMNWLLWALDDHERLGAAYPGAMLERTTECKDWSKIVLSTEAKGYVAVDDLVKLTPKGKEEVSRMKALHLTARPQDPPLPKVHVGALGTNARIQQDPDLFYGLQRLLRNILGVEMEAAAVGTVAHQNKIPYLVAKSVVDYADLEKDDNFRIYACEASADFLVSFLLDRSADIGSFTA